MATRTAKSIRIQFRPRQRLPFKNAELNAVLVPHLPTGNGTGKKIMLPPAERTQKILDVLVGSANTRIGAQPTEKAKETMKTRIATSIYRNEAVQAVVNWGPLKFSRELKNSGVDLADLLAVSRLATIDEATKQVHPPGFHFTVYLEDMTSRWLERPELELDRLQTSYTNGLRRLGKVLSPGTITFIRESEILKKRGISPQEYLAKARHNFGFFEEYWKESEPLIHQFLGRHPQYTEEQWNVFCQQNLQHLKSYNALQQIGWIGFIPPKMREYYLRRHPDIAPEQAATEVCKYFATTLLKHQWKLFSGPEHLPAPIKISFVSTTPGAPKEINDSPKADLRILPKTIASTHMPSWASKGIITTQDGKVRLCLRPWREVKQNGQMLAAKIIISRGSRKVPVKADTLA